MTTVEIKLDWERLWLLGPDWAFRLSPSMRINDGDVWLDADVVEDSGRTTPIRLKGEMRSGGFHTSGDYFIPGAMNG